MAQKNNPLKEMIESGELKPESFTVEQMMSGGHVSTEKVSPEFLQKIKKVNESVDQARGKIVSTNNDGLVGSKPNTTTPTPMGGDSMMGGDREAQMYAEMERKTKEMLANKQQVMGGGARQMNEQGAAIGGTGLEPSNFTSYNPNNMSNAMGSVPMDSIDKIVEQRLSSIKDDILNIAKEVLKDTIVELYTEEKILKVVNNRLRELTQKKKT
jgi:hypothetical protein